MYALTQRGEASGFCYVNDAVVAILELRRAFDRVAYVDLDLHDGDGVASAFQHASSSRSDGGSTRWRKRKQVMTVSVHVSAPGVFPPARHASAHDAARSSGHSGLALSVPTRAGLSGPQFVRLVRECVVPALQAFRPDALVVQAGCDGLARDPLAVSAGAPWNVDLRHFGEAFELVLGAHRRGRKTLVLGGGGYDNPNAARCWTYLTSIAVRLPHLTKARGQRIEQTERVTQMGEALSLETRIPHDVAMWPAYAPTWTLDVRASAGMRDENDDASVRDTVHAFEAHVSRLERR